MQRSAARGLRFGSESVRQLSRLLTLAKIDGPLAIEVTDPNHSALNAAVAACNGASAADRQLDAIIASAIFPGIISLPALDTAVWRHEDGTRVRALRYSESRSAATTLVPAGCWLDDGGNGIARVCGPDGEWEGIHSIAEIAICIAALKARIELAQFPD